MRRIFDNILWIFVSFFCSRALLVSCVTFGFSRFICSSLLWYIDWFDVYNWIVLVFGYALQLFGVLSVSISRNAGILQPIIEYLKFGIGL